MSSLALLVADSRAQRSENNECRTFVKAKHLMQEVGAFRAQDLTVIDAWPDYTSPDHVSTHRMPTA